MLTYYLKCKRNTESVDSNVKKLKLVEQCYYQNVLYKVMKNQDLSKNKKQKDY